MPILTRRFAEGIRIGDDIHVVVLGINGKQVRIANQMRIGIQAPRNPIVRRAPSRGWPGWV